MGKAEKKPEAVPLRVLILEDDPADAELVQRALRRDGIRFSARVTKNRREFSAALERFLPQVILSDFKLPGFDGMAALALARARAPEIPFIFVSGSIGEEKAIETLSQGASDYILKDNLARLGPVVKRVLAEAETRRQKAETEKSLRESERMFSTLVANLPGFVYRCRNDHDWTMEYISEGCREITGYGPEDLIASRKLAFGDIIRPDFRQSIWKEWQRRLKRREPFEFEYAIRNAAGEERWVWERGRGVFAANGKLLFLEGFITDISERMKAELLRKEALAETERLRQALDQVPVYVYMKDPRSRYTYANQLTLELFGCSAEELPGSSDSRFFPPGTVKKLHRIDRRVLAGESTVEEISIPDPVHGERIYLEVKTPIYADARGGKVRGLLGISSNITDRRHHEQALRESEEKYRTLVAESPDGIFIADLQGNFISVNPSMCSGLGYSEHELLAMKIWDIVPERYRAQHEQRLAGLLAGKARNEAAEYLVRTRDGRERYVAILSAPYTRGRTLAGFMGIARDITEKMEMETRLRSSEEFHRTLIETSPDAIITVDGGGRITFASQRALDLFAVPGGSDVLGISVLDFVDPSDAIRVQDRLVEILSGSSQPEIREYRLRRHDGGLFWSEVSSAALRDSQGRKTGLLLVCRDVSERKRTETALRESEAKYRLIADNTAETITVLDFDLKFTYVSPSILKLRGLTVAEASAQTLAQTLTPASLERVRRVFAEELALEAAGGADPERSRTVELEEFCKDGSVIIVENTLSFLRDEQGKAIGVLAVARDVTERRQQQEALRRSEEKFRRIFEEHAAVKLLLDPVSGAIIDANQAAENFYGWTRQELKRMTIGQINTLPAEELRVELKRTREEGRVYFQFRHRLADGSVRDVEVFSSRIQIEGNDFLHSIIHDISERKRAEAALRHSENLLSKIFDILPIGLWLADASGRLMRSNEAGRRIWGAEPLVGQEKYGVFKARRLPGAEEIAPEDWALAHTIREKATVTDEMLEIDAFDGTKKIVLNYTAPVLDDKGKLEAAIVVNLDITDRHQAEESLRASLREKEVLLQEIHHRVKNNLQIVSGLLTMQAGHATDKSPEEMFRESQDRIRSIALVHESLYKSHNLAEIAFDDYLRVLVDNLVTSHFAAGCRIAVQYDMQRILLTIETAIPLGLIVNELVSNSLKHAFPGGRRGEIRVALRGREPERFIGVKTKSGTLYRVPTCELTVADDGVGLPAGFELARQKSLGIQILSMLARQLNGELTVHGGPGTEWRIIIPAQPLKAKAHEAKT